MVRTSPQPKLVYVAQARHGVTQAQFTTRWREHAALGMCQARWRNVAKYLHCDPVLPEGSALAGLDVLQAAGIAVVQYRSEAARLAHIADEPARQTMKADELSTFAQPVARTALLTAEHLLKPGVDAAYRLFIFWKSAATGFQDGWLDFGAGQRITLAQSASITWAAQNLPVLPKLSRIDGLDADGIDEFASDDLQGLVELARYWTASCGLSAQASVAFMKAVVLHDLARAPDS
ncbi:MAG: hypothetical protein V4731_04830 [Pseudomonadota bacterium]